MDQRQSGQHREQTAAINARTAFEFLRNILDAKAPFQQPYLSSAKSVGFVLGGPNLHSESV